MLFMCLAVLAVIVVALGLGFIVYFTFFSHNLLQNRSDDFALNGVQPFNANDYVGKINNLIAHSRELVFNSRQACLRIESEERFGHLAPLATQLLDESRDGATLVATERDRFVHFSIANLRQFLKEADSRGNQKISLLNASAYDPQITGCSVGSLQNIESNAEASNGVPDLLTYDQEKRYIQRVAGTSGTNGTNLYRANINLKLPEPDSDLKFELSPLPAPVNGTVSPIRMIAGSSFRKDFALRKDGKDCPDDCKLMPSALQVEMKMQVKGKAISELQAGEKTISTAATNGANLEPP